MMNKEVIRFLLIASISYIILASGCVDSSTQLQPSSKKSTASKKSIAVELFDSIDIPPEDITVNGSSLESRVREHYSWAYTKNGIGKSISEGSAFIMRIHFTYPLGNPEGYSAGVRLNVKYHPDIISALIPVSGDYELTDSFQDIGPEGGIIRVNEYRYGSYGELKRGEEQEILLIGATKELRYMDEAVTPIYLGFSVYGEEFINKSVSIRIIGQ